MPRTKRVLFERLTWEAGPPHSTFPATTADEEATAALVALGGFQCNACHCSLSAEKGYTCCHQAYCPYCGRSTMRWSPNINDVCPHHVLSFGRQRWTPRFYTVFAQARHKQGKDEARLSDIWLALITPTPPARHLPGQKVSGYPQWTSDQLAQAYTPDVLPHLEAFFGPTLREFRTTRLGPALLDVLRPDIRTAVSDNDYHWEDNYFCAEPWQALVRAEAFLHNLHAGTKRLRAMPPETIVRPQRACVIAVQYG